MKGNKKKHLSESALFRLLGTFSKKEIKSFEKFVASPFYNSHKSLIRLTKEVLSFHPNFTGKSFTRENLFSKTNPGKDYDDVLFRKQLSNLLKLVEEYLITVDVNSHADRRFTFLLDQLERRNQFSMFRRFSNEMESDKNDLRIITNESFYYKHFREELKSSFEIRTNNLQNLRPSILKSHLYLLLHSLLTSCVYGNMMLVNSKSFRDSEEADIYSEFFKVFDLIKYLERSDFLNETEKLFVEVCKQDMMLMKSFDDKERLEAMKSSVLKLSPFLNKKLQYIFYSHLNIFYLLNISQGRDEISHDLLSNYKLMVDNDLYISGDREYINFSEYRTILLYALKLKDIEWAQSFIEKFSNHHSPDQRKNILNYSDAILNFELRKFDESLKYISKLDVDNLIMRLDADALKIMIHYEKDFLDSALSVAESFKYFLRNNKILSKEVVRSQLDFIRIIIFLIRNKHARISELEYRRYRLELDQNPLIRRRSWLIRNLDNISRRS